MNYYDANSVAHESAEKRYIRESATLCDCGSIAEHGQVYCSECLDNVDFAMRNMIKIIMHLNGWSEDEAEQAACYWLENIEEFNDRRKYEEVNRNTKGA